MSAPTLLVANRGEIARRVMRSARSMGLRCVAVYVEADEASPHVADADEAVRLETSYLDPEALVQAALRLGAPLVHPGYGFLAENAEFAARVEEAGLTWVGPTPETIARMGDKLAAKKLAERVGVPALPSTEDPSDPGAVGFPLLVKAAGGGGGKGMRIVHAPAGLEPALAAARREAQAAFHDDRVFLERYLARARHIEVQILGDGRGGLIHLGERECSIQRRHQKIVEESPSPRVDESLRRALGDAALRLGRALEYRSAGTVEFLLDDETGEFFFLEVNTRLQVEHPVTEAVTGLDLVREQIRIARGERLELDPDDLRFHGAAVEARLYAEDPARGFLPATGRLHAFWPAAEPAVRWDSGVVDGSVVGPDFDPLLAKVIAHAPTRREAAERLALALERTHLGGVTTNRDFLVATLRAPEFLAGETTTDFIDRVRPAPAVEWSDDARHRAARAAALWIQGAHREAAQTLGATPSGWRNARLPDQRIDLEDGEGVLSVTYRRLRDGRFPLDDGRLARIHRWSSSSIDVEIEGRRACVRVARAGDHLYLHTPDGSLELAVRPRFEIRRPEAPSGGLVAPMPGTVLEIRVAVGDAVSAGQTLLVLEAMKMEHPVAAPEDGVVTDVHVEEGQQVESGVLLLLVEPSEAGA